MCEFVSWIEANTEGEPVLLCLTAKDLRSSKGRKLKDRIGEDINGHGAIREYYDLKPGFGVDKECTDFSTPDNFPAEIVEDIKAGLFQGFGNPEGLLTGPAWAEFVKVNDTAYAEFKKVRDPAHAEFVKVRDPAWAKFNKVRNTAHAEFNKVCALARAEYEKVCNTALAEFNKVCALARAEFNKVNALAHAEFEKASDNTFWDLFADQSNRMEQWKDG